MKFTYLNLHFDLELRLDRVNRAVIENVQEFVRLATALARLTNGESEDVRIYDEEREVKQKQIEVIFSPIELSLNKKENIKRLVSYLGDEFEVSEDYEKFIEIRGKVIEIVDKIKFKTEYEIEVKYDFDLCDIFKMLDVGFLEEDFGLTEKIINYLKIANRLMDKKIFIFINAEAYFSRDDIEEMHKVAEYENVILLFVESKQSTLTIETNEIIIDNSLCEIR